MLRALVVVATIIAAVRSQGDVCGWDEQSATCQVANTSLPNAGELTQFAETVRTCFDNATQVANVTSGCKADVPGCKNATFEDQPPPFALCAPASFSGTSLAGLQTLVAERDACAAAGNTTAACEAARSAYWAALGCGSCGATEHAAVRSLQRCRPYTTAAACNGAAAVDGPASIAAGGHSLRGFTVIAPAAGPGAAPAAPADSAALPSMLEAPAIAPAPAAQRAAVGPARAGPSAGVPSPIIAAMLDFMPDTVPAAAPEVAPPLRALAAPAGADSAPEATTPRCLGRRATPAGAARSVPTAVPPLTLPPLGPPCLDDVLAMPGPPWGALAATPTTAGPAAGAPQQDSEEPLATDAAAPSQRHPWIPIGTPRQWLLPDPVTSPAGDAIATDGGRPLHGDADASAGAGVTAQHGGSGGLGGGEAGSGSMATAAAAVWSVVAAGAMLCAAL
eukprot:jgi/Ulvmu1/12597/UM092_0027.1